MLKKAGFSRNLLIISLSFVFIIGCGPNAYQIRNTGVQLLYQHELTPANEKFVEADKIYKDNQDRLLFQMDVAIGYTITDQSELAKKYYVAIFKTLQNMEERGEFRKAGTTLKASKNRDYVPSLAERLTLKYLYAALLFKEGDYNDALIELKQLKLAAGDKAELPETEMLMGLCYLKMNNYNDAEISMRYVLERKETVEPLYYYLMEIYREKKDRSQMGWLQSKYKAQFNRSLMDLGAKYKEAEPKVLLLLYATSLDNIIEIYKGSNFEIGYFVGTPTPFVTTGEVAGKVAKELAGAVGREVLSQATMGCSEIFTGSSTDFQDNRAWASRPAGFGLAFVQTNEPNPSITIICKRVKNNATVFTSSNQVTFGESGFDFFHVSGKTQGGGGGCGF
jgi:tetratricopeptide (TPR) repeat protein